jgi:hypothetical protein
MSNDDKLLQSIMGVVGNDHVPEEPKEQMLFNETLEHKPRTIEEQARAVLLTEGKLATDFEAFIVVAFNGGPSKDPDTLAANGLTVEYYKEHSAAAKKIAKELKQKLSSRSKMTHFGKGGGKVSAKWKKWGGSNNTPKTDLYIGNKYKISLKEAGGSQLLSAKAGEAISTFHAAVDYMSKSSKEVKKLVQSVENAMREIVVPKNAGMNIGEFTKIAKSGAKGVRGKMKQLMTDYLQTSSSLKPLTQNLKSYFETNPEFKRWFVYEAATGEKKFADELAPANWVLKFDTSGKVHQLEPLSSGVASPTVAIDKLAAKVGLRVSWKTPTSKGNKTYVALRGDIKKAPVAESFTLNDLIEQETDNFITENAEYFNDTTLLTEGVLGNLWGKVTNWFKRMFKTIIDTVKRIASAGIDAVLNFFGYEVSSVQVSGLEF